MSTRPDLVGYRRVVRAGVVMALACALATALSACGSSTAVKQVPVTSFADGMVVTLEGIAPAGFADVKGKPQAVVFAFTGTPWRLRQWQVDYLGGSLTPELETKGQYYRISGTVADQAQSIQATAVVPTQPTGLVPPVRDQLSSLDLSTPASGTPVTVYGLAYAGKPVAPFRVLFVIQEKPAGQSNPFAALDSQYAVADGKTVLQRADGSVGTLGAADLKPFQPKRGTPPPNITAQLELRGDAVYLKGLRIEKQ